MPAGVLVCGLERDAIADAVLVGAQIQAGNTATEGHALVLIADRCESRTDLGIGPNTAAVVQAAQRMHVADRRAEVTPKHTTGVQANGREHLIADLGTTIGVAGIHVAALRVNTDIAHTNFRFDGQVLLWMNEVSGIHRTGENRTVNGCARTTEDALAEVQIAETLVGVQETAGHTGANTADMNAVVFKTDLGGIVGGHGQTRERHAGESQRGDNEMLLHDGTP
uniref:Uncharacterized protein n=1 Tax=mine drainage metagenome TaxID=410659 RepID=E6QCI9_9ZZZZ